MLICNSINKSYDKQTIFNNFSYVFPDKGFIALFGKSGCGKTTLLNIIAGTTDFDSGSIEYYNKSYKNRFQSDDIAYITQDACFINFLTVKENLELSTLDDDLIFSMLKKFNIIDKINNFPSTLSGGEKQRLALIRALLLKKSIILLDEPTAALDRQNTIAIFELLKKLSKDILVICSSHDKKVLNFADQIIDFSKLEHYDILDKNIIDKNINSDLYTSNKPKRNLQSYFFLWYKRNKNQKKNNIAMAFIIFLSIIAISICDTPNNKYMDNIENTYHINQFKLTTQKINDDIIKKLYKDIDVKEISLSYAESVPILVDYENSSIISDYDLTVDTLPYSKDVFPFSKKILYGSYFTDVNQIILSIEKANELGNPEDIIGSTIELNLYNNKCTLEIIGIFGTFNEFERQYFKASGITISESGNYFINSKLTSYYEEDSSFFMYGHRSYIVYCESFQKMCEVYNKYFYDTGNCTFTFADIDGSIKNLFDIMFYVVSPFVIMTVLITILFYFQSQRITFAYNKHIFSEFVFLGYRIKEIRRVIILSNYIELTKIFMISSGIAIPLMLGLNKINSVLLWVPFKIFSFNYLLILSLYFVICLLGIIMACYNVKIVQKYGWYNIMISQRDII